MHRALLSVLLIFHVGSYSELFAQSAATTTQVTPSLADIRNAIPHADEIALMKTMSRIAIPGDASTARSGAEAILEGTSAGGKVKARYGLKVTKNEFSNVFVDATLTGKLDQTTDRTALAEVNSLQLADDAEFTVGGAWTKSVPKLSEGTSLATIQEACDRLRAEQNENVCASDTLSAEVLERLFPLIDVQNTFSIGARFAAGRSKFSYRSAPEAATVTDRHYTPVTMTATVAKLLFASVFVGAQLGGETVWKGEQAKTICTETSVSTVSTCESVAIGIPSSKDGFVLVLEGRYFFKGGRFYSRGAIAPRFEYRGAKDLKVLEIPYYFLSDPVKGQWTGGVMFRLKNGDPSYVVFVGPTLALFGF